MPFPLFRGRGPAARMSVRLLVRMGRVLPPEVLREIGGALGFLYAHFSGRRRLALANVRTAFNGISKRRAQRIVRCSYRHFGRMAADFFLIPRHAPRIRRMVAVDSTSWRAFMDAAKSGRGVVFVTLHLGNWEIPPALIVRQGAGVSAIYRPQPVAALDELIAQYRRLLGYHLISKPVPVRLKLKYREIIFRDESMHRKVRRALAGGGVLIFLADQNAHGSGVPTEFFGVKASTARGPFVYARRTGARVFFAAMPVASGGKMELHVREYNMARTGDLRADLASDCAEMNRFFESIIRKWPCQWLWSHDRWGLKHD